LEKRCRYAVPARTVTKSPGNCNVKQCKAVVRNSTLSIQCHIAVLSLLSLRYWAPELQKFLHCDSSGPTV